VRGGRDGLVAVAGVGLVDAFSGGGCGEGVFGGKEGGGGFAVNDAVGFGLLGTGERGEPGEVLRVRISGGMAERAVPGEVLRVRIFASFSANSLVTPS